jgi:transposase
MIMPPAGIRVLIATRPVDFRRGADGLAATVQTILQQDPFCGTIFVFCSKRADCVKMLVYDGTALVLIWKRVNPQHAGLNCTNNTENAPN